MAIVEMRGGSLRKHLERQTKDELVRRYMELLRAYEKARPGIQIMIAELAVDVYAGESCDQHQPYWRASAEGDRDGAGGVPNPLTLDAETFRPGTQIFVYEPQCPACGQVREFCEYDDGCGFDWQQRDEERYA